MKKLTVKILATVTSLALVLCNTFVMSVDAASVSERKLLDTKGGSVELKSLQSEILDEEVCCQFSRQDEKTRISPLAETRRVANIYGWGSGTMAYDFANQRWSDDTEVFSTYTKNSDGFVMSGRLSNPKGYGDFNTALREGYLNDSEYSENQGHYYRNVVASETYGGLTFMLESNVNVFIFDDDVNLIYRSSDEAGVTSYFTRYYSTTKNIEGVSNKVISLGLISGEGYYIVFQKKDADVTSSSHYGYYAGQPLPILDSTTASNLAHHTTIKWDQRSYSQSAVAQTLTISCPSGYENQYALKYVTFVDKSKPLSNNMYASSIDYYYTPPTTNLSRKLTQTGGWWSDLVDSTPPSGSIHGNYATKVTVNWEKKLTYVGASCTTMTQMTIDYLVPFGIIAE